MMEPVGHMDILMADIASDTCGSWVWNCIHPGGDVVLWAVENWLPWLLRLRVSSGADINDGDLWLSLLLWVATISCLGIGLMLRILWVSWLLVTLGLWIVIGGWLMHSVSVVVLGDVEVTGTLWVLHLGVVGLHGLELGLKSVLLLGHRSFLRLELCLESGDLFFSVISLGFSLCELGSHLSFLGLLLHLLLLNLSQDLLLILLELGKLLLGLFSLSGEPLVLGLKLLLHLLVSASTNWLEDRNEMDVTS